MDKKRLLIQWFAVILLINQGWVFAETGLKKTIGWIEPVQLMPEQFVVAAKIDTGADNSSLDADDIEVFMHEGVEWVRFTTRNNNDESLVLQRPLLRYTFIKRKKSEPLKRPVVNMLLCLDNQQIEAPVNLAQRDNFKYRMLIGRSFLSGHFLVDSAEKQLTTPSCKMF